MAGDFFRYPLRYFVPVSLLLIALVWLLPAQSVRTETTGTLLVLGDSISAAYGIDEQQGWVQLLRQRLASDGENVTVVNASASGETSSGGLARLPQLLKRHQPQWLIVELGGNDGLRGYPPRVLKQNLQRMVKLAQSQDVQVLILGMRMPPNYGKAYVEAFAKVYPQVAKAQQVPLVRFFLEPVILKKGAMQADGIHPAASAQPVLLDYVWPQIQQLLTGSED